MPLRGIKIMEFVGLAPGPFCGKILSDFGASVLRIDKNVNNFLDVLQDGKRTIALNIKNPKSQMLIKELSQFYDVLIEPFRPGVMEKYDLGPHTLLKENPKLIYARLTGFGQTGPLASRAGHDLNYLALSGVLSLLGRKSENPTAPINLLADFASGSLLCAFGICLALLERHKSGKGQIIDNSMVEGCAYLASWVTMSKKLPIWGKPRGENVLDTGAFFYDTYKTKDGKFMSVAPIEPQFFEEFIKIIGLPELLQFSDNEECKKKVAEKFLTKTQKEWSKIFEKTDSCVFPVIEWEHVMDHDHNKIRKSFYKENDVIIAKPAPLLSRTPGSCQSSINKKDSFYEAIDVLSEIGKTEKDVCELIEDGVIFVSQDNKL